MQLSKADKIEPFPGKGHSSPEDEELPLVMI